VHCSAPSIIDKWSVLGMITKIVI